ncbi:hypothetical protein QNI19_01100 [Cytophagaceae bacterium DM2B3-1]|uniref:Uncharacterized protein n=1 Tax=Xanthocytophaga flava TaxID=3048013 RepID=A0ABT7CCV7_9BACT|nr:hypothetical protein [Xanthocytophaga flavus]MDJ1491504.1 hypothetical protein [Xanthocytophaga flavus]
MISFEEYLIGKKIDSEAFQRQEHKRWKDYKNIFEQVHPESFTTQKKFVINDLRRQYHLKESTVQIDIVTEKKSGAKPVMKPAVSKPIENKIQETEGEEPIATKEPVAEKPADMPVKKPGKPVMRPVVKKVESGTVDKIETDANTNVSEEKPLSSETISQKPARPIIKPVLKKPASDVSESESSVENTQSPETEKVESTPPKPAKPVIRPVIKKSPAPSEETTQDQEINISSVTSENADNLLPAQESTPKKPARPIIKPVIKKKDENSQ